MKFSKTGEPNGTNHCLKKGTRTLKGKPVEIFSAKYYPTWYEGKPSILAMLKTSKGALCEIHPFENETARDTALSDCTPPYVPSVKKEGQLKNTTAYSKETKDSKSTSTLEKISNLYAKYVTLEDLEIPTSIRWNSGEGNVKDTEGFIWKIGSKASPSKPKQDMTYSEMPLKVAKYDYPMIPLKHLKGNKNDTLETNRKSNRKTNRGDESPHYGKTARQYAGHFSPHIFSGSKGKANIARVDSGSD